MLQRWYAGFAATLVDGDVCLFEDDPHALPLKPFHQESVITALACQHGGIQLVRTHEHRFLISQSPAGKQTDITDMISSAIDTELSSIADELFACNKYVVVRTSRVLCMIGFDSKTGLYAIAQKLELESDIDLVSFDWGHGFVRTIDGTLRAFGRLNHYNTRGNDISMGSVLFSIRTVVFSNTASITKIVCGPSCSLILMNDGKVYGEGKGHESPFVDWSRRGFCPVIFPDHVCIIKIAINCNNIIYTSSDGSCYYGTTTGAGGISEDKCLRPVLVETLSGYFVEDVWVLDECVIVQYDGSKLCVLPMRRGHDRCYDSWYYLHYSCLLARDPIPISFFDDMNVINIVQLKHRIAFVTEERSVYESMSVPYYSNKLTIDSLNINAVPFFENNPIAVQSPIQKIPSALSI